MHFTAVIALMFACFGLPTAARAQLDQAITSPEMIEPWTNANAVLVALTATPAGADPKSIVQALAALEPALNTYQAQQESVATRIVGDPAFSYDAAEISLEMANALATVGERFDSLWSAAGISTRNDVQRARGALSALQRKLAQRNPFERDVVRALGSGGRQEILGLSTRWWDAVSAVDQVLAALAALRRGMETARRSIEVREAAATVWLPSAQR